MEQKKKAENVLSQLDITLNIRNNTNYPQQVNIMGNPSDSLDNANVKTEYRWDVTGYSFTNETNVSIMYKTNTSLVYQIFIAALETQTLQSVTDALNTLGIGVFNLYNELGQDYIGIYNSSYQFELLNIYNAAIPQLLYSFNTIGTGGTNDISINFVPVVSDPNPTVSVGYIPIVLNDLVIFNGLTSNYGSTNLFVQNVKNNFISLNQNLPASTVYSYGSFAVQAPYYLIQVYDA